VLISHAAHGSATSSLDGTGEITLRDGLVVAAAAVGSHVREAWVLEREIVPQGWIDAPVDLMISRKTGQTLRLVAGVELKWWRRADPGNAANRRRDLVKDFMRAAALYPSVESASFVVLLCLRRSWFATTRTRGSDHEAMSKVSATGIQKWNMTRMSDSSAVRGALRLLRNRVSICNIFHSELLSTSTLSSSGEVSALAAVWAIKKPQNTRILTTAEVDALLV
jgi:hypothetical protein